MTLNYDKDGNLHRAVLNAAEAAREVRLSFPDGARLTFSAYPEQVGLETYKRLWTLYDAEGADIWAYSDEHSDQLLRQDLIKDRLHDAVMACPDVLVRRDHLGPNEYVLDIDVALKLDAILAGERLYRHAVDDAEVTWLALSELVHDVAGEEASTAYNNGERDDLDDDTAYGVLHDEADERASQVNNNGMQAQSVYLLDQVGERDAWVAIEGACEPRVATSA